MPDKEFKLRIEGPGVDVSQDLNRKQVLQVLSIAFGDGSEPEINNQNLAEEHSGGDKGGNLDEGKASSANVSIGEFMADLQVNSNTDRIAAVALYSRDQLSTPQITKDDIPDWFKKAGEAAPKNLPRDLSNAVKRRLIAEDHTDSGHYYVTATGERTLRNSK